MNQRSVRGIRGAVAPVVNSPEDILRATEELLLRMLAANAIATEDIASVLFSVTSDLNADFPAPAVRRMGWLQVPLMCTNEIDVPGSLKGVVRVLMHVNTELSQAEIQHIYLGEAMRLRPDLGK